MQVTVLGSGQDAGVPQMLCGCRHCTAAHANAARRRTASSLYIEHEGKGIILDPSPDIHQQWLGVGPTAPLDAVAVTHAHAGHVLGLGRLGKEGPDRPLALHASHALTDWLAANAPWSDLPLERRPFHAGDRFMAAGVEMTAMPLRHRAEYADTVAFLVHGDRLVLYLPDTDAWDSAATGCLDKLKAGDAAIVDATFWSGAEMAHRDVSQIPHPFVLDSLELLASHAARGVEVYLSHINHTNPLNDPDSPEFEEVRSHGLRMASDGLRL